MCSYMVLVTKNGIPRGRTLNFITEYDSSRFNWIISIILNEEDLKTINHKI